MRIPHSLPSSSDLAGAWCNGDAVASSVLEAISFVTPVLEKFFIRTVADLCPDRGAPELEACRRAFIREEASHSRAHRRFNAALAGYLGGPPPGLATIAGLLRRVERRLSPRTRLLLVASLEHFTAVSSKAYLRWQGGWHFSCAGPGELFAAHAREELGHRSVVFDLWRSRGAAGRAGRLFAVGATLLAGAAYLSLAGLWILHRKSGRRPVATLRTLAAFIAGRLRERAVGLPLRELFLFARADFHPRRLVDDAVGASSLSVHKEPA